MVAALLFSLSVLNAGFKKGMYSSSADVANDLFYGHLLSKKLAYVTTILIPS